MSDQVGRNGESQGSESNGEEAGTERKKAEALR